MGQTVDAGVSGKPLGHRHDELRIDNRHIRTQRVVGQRHFAPACFVEKNRKRSHFTTRSAGRGDGNQARRINFFGRVLDHALAEIQKRGTQLLKVRFRRFVLKLHHLRRVDHRPTAQRDDLVRLVEVQCLHSFHHRLQFGLGVRNHRDMDESLWGKIASDNIYVADLF